MRPLYCDRCGYVLESCRQCGALKCSCATDQGTQHYDKRGVPYIVRKKTARVDQLEFAV